MTYTPSPWPFTPRRTGPDFAVDADGFPITTNTRPADLDDARPVAAEASTELGAEQPPRIPRSRQPISAWGVATVLVMLTSGIAAVGGLVHLAALLGWLPGA